MSKETTKAKLQEVKEKITQISIDYMNFLQPKNFDEVNEILQPFYEIEESIDKTLEKINLCK